VSETKEDQQRTFPSLMAEPSVFCRYVPHSRSMPAPNTAAHYTNRVENETNINGTEETTEVTRGEMGIGQRTVASPVVVY
jgi:hypothetical protein